MFSKKFNISIVNYKIAITCYQSHYWINESKQKVNHQIEIIALTTAHSNLFTTNWVYTIQFTLGMNNGYLRCFNSSGSKNVEFDAMQ